MYRSLFRGEIRLKGIQLKSVFNIDSDDVPFYRNVVTFAFTFEEAPDRAIFTVNFSQSGEEAT